MSRQKANFEPLFSVHAPNFDDKYVIKSIKVSEARGMSERKETLRFCRHCGRSADTIRCRSTVTGQHSMVSKLREPRHDKRSVATITLGEATAFAGTAFKHGQSKTLDQGEYQRRDLLASGEVHDLEDFVEQAVVKVDEWPLTGDDRAIRVPGISATEMHRLMQLKELRLIQALAY